MAIIDYVRRAMATFIMDDESRKKRQLFYLELILGSIATVMSIINIFTHMSALLAATALMSVASFANAFIIRRDNTFRIGVRVFLLKMILLLSYFVIYGGTEGFSTIWLLLVPACGMIVFGRRDGLILSMTLFIELVVCFYTPLREILPCQEYTQAFLLRFPVVYLCFNAIGYYLEYVRETTYKEMDRMRKEAQHQSTHDTLTGVLNRLGFNRELEAFVAKANAGKHFALLIIDVDHFKSINDRYGHDIGDDVLRTIAERIAVAVGTDGVACRWGGEEFAVLLKEMNVDEYYAKAECIRCAVHPPIFVGADKLCTTISIGCACSNELDVISATGMIHLADARVYCAKEAGRNCCVNK